MELHDENNTGPVGLSPSKKGSSQPPLTEPVSAIPARRLPPREGYAPSFRLKAEADLLEKDRSSPGFWSCDDPNPMGEGGQKRTQIQEAETKPKRQANQRLFLRATSMVIRATKTQAGEQQKDPKQSNSPSPESPLQKTTSARWDRSEKLKRHLYRAASMRDWAFKRSDPVGKDILDDHDDDMAAMVENDGGNQPSKKAQETIEMFPQSCMNLNFETPIAQSPDSALQRMTSARWNDKSDNPNRQSSQRLLHRAASMQGLAFKVSDQVDKDILDDDDDDDDDDETTAMVDDSGTRPSQKAQERIKMLSQSCMNLNFESPIAQSPDSALQRMTSARWNDKSDNPKRQSSQRLLQRAASMQGLAFKVSDQVDKDILDDDDDDDDVMTAMVDDTGTLPSQKARDMIKMLSQSCMNLNFEHKTSDGPDVEVFQKSKAQIDDDEPDIEVFRPSPSQWRRSSSSRNMKQSIDEDESAIKVFCLSPLQRRMSSSSRNLKYSTAQVDNDESDEPNVKVFSLSPAQRRLSSSSSQRILSSSSSQRRLSSSSSQRRLSSSSSQRRLSSSSSQHRLSTSSRRPLPTQEEEHSHALQRSITDLSQRSRFGEDRWAGARILERSLTDLMPRTRPSKALQVRSSELARAKDLLIKFEKSFADLGMTRSTDVERLLSELKKSLNDFPLAKVSDLDLTDASNERRPTEFIRAESFEQQCRTSAGDGSANLRDNSSCSSISIDDLYNHQEATQASCRDRTRPTPISHEKEDLYPKRSIQREQQKDALKSSEGEPCDSRHFESSLQLSGIYIMPDLKNESNSSMHQSSEESLNHSKVSAERTPEAAQEKVELAVERSVHDSSKLIFRNKAFLQGSAGHVSSKSLASSIGVGSLSRALQGGRDQSQRTPKEEGRTRREPASTSNPARIRRAPGRSYSMYSGTNSFLADIADVSDEEESTATDHTKDKNSGRRGRRRSETHDAMLARIQRETAEQDLHKSLDGSYEFQL